MKIVLREDVKGVGRKYEIKNVSDGYANNFLIPRKLAEYASPEVVKKAQVKKLQGEAKLQIKEELTKKQIEMLKNVVIIMKKKASEKGHLFEKIHSEEISRALKEQSQIQIEPEFIKIEISIKEVGEHTVFAEVGKNKGEFKLIVEAES